MIIFFPAPNSSLTLLPAQLHVLSLKNKTKTRTKQTNQKQLQNPHPNKKYMRAYHTHTPHRVGPPRVWLTYLMTVHWRKRRFFPFPAGVNRFLGRNGILCAFPVVSTMISSGLNLSCACCRSLCGFIFYQSCCVQTSFFLGVVHSLQLIQSFCLLCHRDP